MVMNDETVPQWKDLPPWKELPPTEQCLCLSRQAAHIIGTIDDTLLLLAEKRTTLEEKMIAKYFHELAEHYGRLATKIHHHCRQGADDTLPDSALRDDTNSLNCRVKDTVDELLKIARYNFNFLEQYFEHDYFESLVEEHRFIEALDALLKRYG